MKTYERLFGAGPRGALLATILVIITWYLEDIAGLPRICTNDVLRLAGFIVFTVIGIAIVAWSLTSLPPGERGRRLVTTGAFQYFRHPLYAAFLLFINVGFAFLMNNWIYLIWVVILFPLWTINIRSEETLMRQTFGEEYDMYCSNTWRFIPKIWK